jgi:excisionase family DNA binding protein
MPWRTDFVESFWLDPDWKGFAGYPGRKPPEPPKPPEPAEPDQRAMIDAIEAHAPTHVNLNYLTSGPPSPPQRLFRAAVISVRDRIGFRYERSIGLDDLVSVREAAHLLHLPVMTISRWVKKKEMKSAKHRGFTVIRLREVLRVARERDIGLTAGSRLTILGQEKKL